MSQTPHILKKSQWIKSSTSKVMLSNPAWSIHCVAPQIDYFQLSLLFLNTDTLLSQPLARSLASYFTEKIKIIRTGRLLPSTQTFNLPACVSLLCLPALYSAEPASSSHWALGPISTHTKPFPLQLTFSLQSSSLSPVKRPISRDSCTIWQVERCPPWIPHPLPATSPFSPPLYS